MAPGSPEFIRAAFDSAPMGPKRKPYKNRGSCLGQLVKYWFILAVLNLVVGAIIAIVFAIVGDDSSSPERPSSTTPAEAFPQAPDVAAFVTGPNFSLMMPGPNLQGSRTLKIDGRPLEITTWSSERSGNTFDVYDIVLDVPMSDELADHAFLAVLADATLQRGGAIESTDIVVLPAGGARHGVIRSASNTTEVHLITSPTHFVVVISTGFTSVRVSEHERMVQTLRFLPV